MACLYIHIDPATRTLLYVGSGGGWERASEFRNRNAIHTAKLQALQAAGWKKNDIVHIVVDELRWGAARKIEAALIRALQPPCNVTDHPWWDDMRRQPMDVRLVPSKVSYEFMAAMAVKP